MKKTTSLWQLVGFAFTSLVGTLLHFLYEWSGGSIIAAPFSAINESTWEHMKLLFWPLFIFAIIEYFFLEKRKGFWCIKLRGTLLGLILIPVLFYTYNGAIGKSPDWLNICIFFVAAGAAFIYETLMFHKEPRESKLDKWAFAVLCIIGGLFILFTFITPPLEIFKEPLR